ncbi:hypothetical protein L208DRAFT_1416777 [Tricholoma matsutake]|nr:hypothetical protein L208DRAFT_1416777 [Tricholoma matsutake 945]
MGRSLSTSRVMEIQSSPSIPKVKFWTFDGIIETVVWTEIQNSCTYSTSTPFKPVRPALSSSAVQEVKECESRILIGVAATYFRSWRDGFGRQACENIEKRTAGCSVETFLKLVQSPTFGDGRHSSLVTNTGQLHTRTCRAQNPCLSTFLHAGRKTSYLAIPSIWTSCGW